MRRMASDCFVLLVTGEDGWVAIRKEKREKTKQAGAGAVPSSTLVNTLVKIEGFFVGDPK